jgi:transposase-like protein
MKYLEKVRWAKGVVSPYDPKAKVYHYGDGRYMCSTTGKYFNIKTNTIFHGTKIPLQKWFMGIYLVTNHKKGISSCQLARDISITQKSAWFMLQKIRENFCCENEWKLNGEVEADETFVGGKNKNRHSDKKVKNSQGRSFKDKTPVLGMLERGGKVIAKVIKDTSVKRITPHILNTVKRTSTLFTDEWCGYNLVSKLYKHYFVDHSKKQYVNENAHTNTIEGFWTWVKRSVMGIYHYVSRKHLQKYVNEFAFHYNTRHLDEVTRFSLLLANTNSRITYKELTCG